MRLASFLVVPLASVAVAAAGLYVASPVSADCESRNGTMLCTDPAPAAPSAPAADRQYPCAIEWYCDDYAWDIVLGGGHDIGDRPDPSPPRPPRPRPKN